MPAAFPRWCASWADLIHRDALTVNGKTMGENTAEAPCWNREVIHEFAATRFGSTRASPWCAATWRRDGAVIKPSAATPRLLQHRGRAVVFERYRGFQSAHRSARIWRSTRIP